MPEEQTSTSKEMDGDDASFIRTEDIICLVCMSGDAMKRGYLAAEGVGSQLCHIEPEPADSEEPSELWKCTFQLEEALSVHAMYSFGLQHREKKLSRKILMYGQTVLLRHVATKKLLRCLSTSPSNDKMAYNIGFTDRPDKSSIDESCWFTVHPASKQRSEGEKVRAGDDMFLVNVANERFLTAQLSYFQNTESDVLSFYKQPLNTVQASFVQCVWALHIVCSGSAKEAAIGYVNGGDVVRFIHRHGQEDCLTVAARNSDKNVTAERTATEVCYELANVSELRSLWRVELFKMRFGGGFTSWGQPFRLRHVVTGKFLGVKVVRSEEGREEKHCVAMLDWNEASREKSAFCFTNSTRMTQEGHLDWNELKVDSMGTPQVKFGDSEVFLLHLASGRLVGCPASERVRHRSRRGVRKVIMQGEVHQSFVFTVTRASEEQAKAASIVQLTEETMRTYVHKTLLHCERVSSDLLTDKLLHVLSDLCYYFRMPERSSMSHDEYQHQLCVLRGRQGLFQKQGMLLFTVAVIVETGKKCRPSSPASEMIHHQLYQLLAAMIRGNRNNCREFATLKWLDVFINQLGMPAFTHDVLDVIQCLLTDSAEVLNIISEKHIETIVNLLSTEGRDSKVMKLLSSLCVCQGVAMRDKQRVIYKHLLNCNDLLPQTSLHDVVHCVHPTLYVSVCEGSAMYKKWYFEVKITTLASELDRPPHFRVGWAHASLFDPRPSSNSFVTTCGAIGDDMFSVGFDGCNFWLGGHRIEPSCIGTKRLQRQDIVMAPDSSDSCSSVSKGDVIGCCLDMEQGCAWFMKNGHVVQGQLQFSHWRDNITPVMSFSAGVSAVLSFGAHLGEFHYNPPADFAGLAEAVEPGRVVELQQFLPLGDPTNLLVSGPCTLEGHQGFVPAPIDTSKVMLPDSVLQIRDQLAKNIHEVWAKNKIEAGYTYDEVRNDDEKHNPSLKPFEDLAEIDRRYDYNMALETLATLVALGYQIGSQETDHAPLKYQDLTPEKYQLSNGYLPCPLDLDGIQLEGALMQLVEKLSENAHNVWAAGRIKEGWTYGMARDAESRRHPMLVPYSQLDASARKSNWDTAHESVRTISALGCTIVPPAASLTQLSTNMQQLAREFAHSNARTRTFRGQTCYRLKRDRWYYEVKLLTDGMMRVGWATSSFPAGQLLGADEHSYAFDGFLACKWHNGSESFGQRWKAGDIVGCLLDLDNNTMSFTLNGTLLHDSFESTFAFEQVNAADGLTPAITLSAGQKAVLNFGKSEEALHSDYTDSCYEPVCSPSSLHYNIPLWYSSPHGTYQFIDSVNHPRLTTKKMASERCNKQGTTPIISVSCKDWDYSKHAHQECLRLNLGVMVTLQGSQPPTMPTINPRPGPLSPTPNPEMEVFQGLTDYFSPKKLIVSYSVVIPAGQDPSSVFIGWTTAGFRYVPSQFQSRSAKSPDPTPPHLRYGQQIDVVAQRRYYRSGTSAQHAVSQYSTAFMVCLNDLLTHSPLHLPVATRVNCVLDTTSGNLTFSCHTGIEGDPSIAQKISFVANAKSKLFPTVITTPSTERVVDFDFSPEIGCNSLSSTLISTRLDPKVPPCPPRMRLMALATSQWIRQPAHKTSFTTQPAAGGALQLSSDKEPAYSIYVTLPEEDTVMDILEVSENEKLLQFYIHTLEAYTAVSSHSNRQLAEAISFMLDHKQLLQCLKVAGTRFSLRAAYFNLFSTLHLAHEVSTRLMMRGEFIIPLSECTKSVPLFPMARQEPEQQVYSIVTAPWPALTNQAKISHNISSTFCRMPCSGSLTFSVEELKELVFADLEQLLRTGYFRGQILPCQGHYEIFVPLLTILDQLLVMGALQEDRDLKRLLALLDSKLFTTGERWFCDGLLSTEVSKEEPVKLALCRLLQHLCDCQVQHRIEAIVTFSHSYVDSLQSEQRERHAANFRTRPKEFRRPAEKQVEEMLSFKRDRNPDCPISHQLQQMLRSFHKNLKQHCGCVDGKSLAYKKLEDMNVKEKLQRLTQLLLTSEEQCKKKSVGDKVTTLQGLITQTMISWLSDEVINPELTQEIFFLLYRQYDEVHEVIQALRKTYVIEVREDSAGRSNYNLQSFRHALGSLRLLLKVGMGKREEKLLKESLKTIRHSDLFYCHPGLMRQLGVYSIALELMKSYLGISSGSSQNHLLTIRRKQKLCMSKEGLPQPVEACCKFLCKFARISSENQRALFPHIGYLLEHSEKHPGLMTYHGHTPLDVVTATIKDNHELALALEETHLEHVISLLVATTTSTSGSQESSVEDALGVIHMGSMSCDWAPNGGEKCLEFLQSAVWVENEQIQENANVLVRLLIHHSECLGPGLAGEAIGMLKVYEEAIEHLDDAPSYMTPPDDSIDSPNRPLQHQESNVSVASSRQSSTSLGLLGTPRLVLSFYTNLIRLLACCAPSSAYATSPTPFSAGLLSSTLSPKGANSLKKSTAERTRNILQNLIKENEIVGILSLPFSQDGLNPAHKEAALLFLDRVYGVTGQELLLQLLTDAFLPDVKIVLKLIETGRQPQLCSSLCRYLCCSVLPLLARHAPMFRLLLSHLHVIDNLLICFFRLSCTSQLSSAQLEEVATTLITVSHELHPRAILHFMPKIIASLPSLQPHAIVPLKLLTSHYKYYARYYEGGMLGKTCLGPATEEEKTYSAIVVHRLLDTLTKELPSSAHLQRYSVSCLKAVSCALSPDCLVPSLSQLSTMCDSSSASYDPRPLDTRKVVIGSELRAFILDFASYQHDNWSYGKQSVGWSYGSEISESKCQHPNLKPFNSLSEQDQAELISPAEDAVKYLLMKGWCLNKVRLLKTTNIPHKPKMTCMRRRKRRALSMIGSVAEESESYEPAVLDLSKVETPIELLALAEKMAENAHDKWARELKISHSDDYLSHSLFLPYELLDEIIKEERRTYALDLLRYLRVAGFEPSRRTRLSAMPSLAQTLQCSQYQEKFALQFFDKFLDLLKQGLNMDFYLKVLFPLLTSYLGQHASYFMPSDCQRGHSFASREEKVKILQLFCRVGEFIRLHIPQLFPLVKKPLLFGHHEEKGPESEDSIMAARGLLTLSEAIIKALDMRSIAKNPSNSVANECDEVVNFFRQATSGIHLTAKNIAKKEEVDVRFQFYCLNVLIPTLTALFRHLGNHSSGRYLIEGAVLNHCRYIFQNLVEMAMGSGPVFVGSSPLIAIGQCMGKFALAFPDPFLEKSLFGFSMASLLDQLHTATIQGVTCGNVLFVVDVIVPVLASYITKWWDSDNDLSPVTAVQVDDVLCQVLSLVAAHFGQTKVRWFIRIIESSLPLAIKCSPSLLESHFVPLLDELRERAISLWQDEQYLLSIRKQGDHQSLERHEALVEDFRIFVRDLLTTLSFLAAFLQANTETIRITPCEAPFGQNLFVSVADIFHCWFSSQIFRRESQSGMQWLLQNIRHLLLHPSMRALQRPTAKGEQGGKEESKKPPNLIVLCLELLLPVSDQLLCPKDRDLVDEYRKKIGKKGSCPEELKMEIMMDLDKRNTNRNNQLAHKLVKSISQRFIKPVNSLDERALHILNLARVRYRIQQVNHPTAGRTRWRQLLTQKRRKAVIDCFLAVPYFELKRHRAINLFLQSYCSTWLVTSEHSNHEMLTEELLDHQDWLADKRSVQRSDPLTQLFTMFKRKASSGECVNESLYTAYIDVLYKSVIGYGEEEDQMVVDNPTKAYEEYYMKRAELIVKQGQLSKRGAASVVLLVITASDGVMSPVVHSTLHLGIALLKEGNQKIQHEMLEQLKGMDVGFLSSFSALISSCSVLDWNAHERYNKSEASNSASFCCKVLPESAFTVSLFRFLQLLCEGHNEAFQNYLRTQAGNTTTVNIIITTVDYLLRLQESISDFYWHYSDHDTIDLTGKDNFLKAFKVVKQVFRTLTEYIQGPCVKNQNALAHSRLWDAVSGFLQVFAVLEKKLYRDTSQFELLRELLGLQEEMYILLLSMLEGSAMSSTIGKLMVDMLVESAQSVEEIMAFFSIFVKLKDVTTSKAFKEYDLNKDGLISYREFEKAMETQQRYTKEEIVYLMECADTNKDGLLDYSEFTERFHHPAENIGFHLCVLLVHLSEHLPHDKRLERFRQFPQGKGLMEHFQKNMGCIEILGKSKRIERVYFEVKGSRMWQWEETQIQESRRNFLHSVETGSQKNKLQGFTNFCEDTIFEMDHADIISGVEQLEKETRADLHRKKHTRALQLPSQPFMSRIKARVSALRRDHTRLQKVVGWMTMLWTLIFTFVIPTCKTAVFSLREKFSIAFLALRQLIMVKTAAPLSSGKRRVAKRNSLRLVIPPPKLQSLKAGVQENGGEPDKRRSSSAQLHTSDVRRRRSSAFTPFTPRLFQLRQLKLEYDRSRLRRPSNSPETPMHPGTHNQEETLAGDSYVPKITVSSRNWRSFLARNYYRLNNFKLLATFVINIMLLTFKISTFSESEAMNVNASMDASTSAELSDPFWTPIFLYLMSVFHFLLSAILIVSYWHLKVPLLIFIREKKVARQLECKQMWVWNSPESMSDAWDGLVISARSFPRKYWDKQVKQRVCDQVGAERRSFIARRLGLEEKSKYEERTKWDIFLETLHSLIDLRYHVWMFGVVLSNPMILYHITYCAFSFMGLWWNSFYFSAHLLDMVMSFKLLRTVLYSVLHNGKQLAMTVLMTCVVIYIYTVIAFNFFRKFYRRVNPESGTEVYNCESMARCFIYHIDQGLRSGGGIADVLAPASGDPYEFLRLLFDITFFFFVIVILLAIIQGLIIDAFGELRDKEEFITMEMQTKCFVCGLPKTEFDHIPHGFDNHISREHNMAHYMFFLLYLIKKKESEFSGQESYVWELYLKRNWDFFPVGDCFYRQEKKKEQLQQQIALGHIPYGMMPHPPMGRRPLPTSASVI